MNTKYGASEKRDNKQKFQSLENLTLREKYAK